MRLVLETTDSGLLTRAEDALRDAGIAYETAPCVLEGGFESWKVEVADAAEADAAAIVSEANNLLLEERSQFRCQRCNRGMIGDPNAEADSEVIEMVCRGCGFRQIVGLQ